MPRAACHPQVSLSPRAVLVEGLLPPQLCDALRGVAEPRLIRSRVSTGGQGGAGGGGGWGGGGMVHADAHLRLANGSMAGRHEHLLFRGTFGGCNLCPGVKHSRSVNMGRTARVGARRRAGLRGRLGVWRGGGWGPGARGARR